ncbi:MAG: anthranilate phosphoribosyltransferase [Alphaproteobacteria bacterium]
MISDIIRQLENGKILDEDEMRRAMSDIMDGNWSDDEIVEFLTHLSNRRESISEITGAAKVMREKALAISAPENSVDCCGTGGDKSGTYNISTAVAIVSAACGVPIAKHGNRSASSKSGAADVLEALEINLNVTQEKLEEALVKYNFAFLMAPRHHGAMKHVANARKSMKTRTIFNILGPLANPAKTKFQLLGVFDRDLVVPIAEVLNNLGTKKAWIVHGSDGLDEITTTGDTYVAKLDNGNITEETLTPESFGLEKSKASDLIGGSPETNANALKEILNGKCNAYKDIVIANTAAVLMISGKEGNLLDAANTARAVIDSGKAYSIFKEYRDFTQNNGDMQK